MSKVKKGVLAVITACMIWGFAPAYYKLMRVVAAPEMLSHRTLWTLVFFGGLLAVQGRLGELWRLLAGPQRWVVVAATLMISANWFIFIWAVQGGHGVEASLGYYIFPLVAVLLGVVGFGEKLSRAQAGAVALAGLAVLVLTYGLGVAPLVALSLALTFAGYSALKRRVVAPALVSVTLEVLVMAPFAIAYLIYATAGYGGAQAGWFGRDLTISLWLPLTGLITGGPLMLFSYAARRVSLATLGLAQYLNPTLQFLTAVLLFAEPFSRWHAVAFTLIWVALGVYSFEAWRQDKAARQDRAARKDAVSSATSAATLK